MSDGRIYPEQYQYMADLKKTLDAGVRKVPYMKFYSRARKLIYCSRTVPEIEKALAELKRLMAYREEMGAKDDGFRGMGLTSRRNLCLHPERREEVVKAEFGCRDTRKWSNVRGSVKAKKDEVA
ncbi:hypothetical protein QFC24_006880 [Naganishia onofrii]|uniref:Uncharacterized protein n=1 Tax=Naganishia onofrii TaxID=1851511 RepID=A0ACC2WZ42_9TREE|nr:hypothetical protein QFC24_006880 [Naganishia onofrii]